jgi:hypothetical protein
MINSSAPPTSEEDEQQSVDTIVRAGPRGAIAVAAVATAVVVALWFGFYLWVFLPRSA